MVGLLSLCKANGACRPDGGGRGLLNPDFLYCHYFFCIGGYDNGVKIAGTIMQDTESYRRAVYLGLKENDLKKIVRKQIGFIYFFPVVCGCFTASFMINRFMEASSAAHVFEITLAAIGLSLGVFLVQLIIFFFLQRKLVVAISGIIYAE